MAKGFAAPGGSTKLRMLLDGSRGEWAVASTVEPVGAYAYGHDSTGLYVQRTGAVDGSLHVTMLYAAQVDLTGIVRLDVEGLWGSEENVNPHMELTVEAAAGGATAAAVLLSCAAASADAVPPKSFSGVLDVSALTGPATVTLHFTIGPDYTDPAVIRVQRVRPVASVDAVPGQTVQDYIGTYSVVPSLTAQTLPTAGKRMLQDVTVEAVCAEELLPAAEGGSF